MRKMIPVLLVLVFLAGAGCPKANGAEAPMLPTGTLVRTYDDAAIFYIENGSRRWIVSEEAFLSQGLRWEDVYVVTGAELSRYEPGEDVTAASDNIILTSEADVLPDLIPLAATDIYLSTENGRRVLRFTSMFWNAGDAMLELVANTDSDPNPGDGYVDTFQRIVRTNGSTRNKIVGNFLWHEAHGHYHYDDFADYVLELIKPTDGTSVSTPIMTKKTTFCMRDDVAIDLTLPNATEKMFSACGKYRQGVSVGWSDRYGHTLPDQYIDVEGLPVGVYRLSFIVDPFQRFLESKQENNKSSALLEIDPARGIVNVLASGAPFTTADNQFPNGMLIKGESDGKVYVIDNNRKHWVRNEEIFHARGLSWSEIYVLPDGVVAAVPNVQLVRAQDTGVVYLLNDAVYKRRLLNPEILESYGWTSNDAMEILSSELALIPDADLIRKEGSDAVFSMSTKKYVGAYPALSDLGFDAESVHTVNEADFMAYATKIYAENLNVPWDIAFLPDGDVLVTERPGQVRRIGLYPAVIDMPDVLHSGEGGLMGIALHPDFASNNYVYLYYTSNNQENRIVRYRLVDNTLVEDKVILEDIPSAIYHDGGQIAFGPDGMLYATTGDANNPDAAQDRGSLAGKTLRLTPDGGIPSDNPYGTAVWSWGHRNAQGLAWDDSGRLWETEHGPSASPPNCCRDELNLIEKGKNYGWPAIKGDEQRDGMLNPVVHSGADAIWAPSGIAFMNGNLFFAGLRGEALYVATPESDGSVSHFSSVLSETFGRLRAVVPGPDGGLYITTSNRDGRGTVRSGDDKIIVVYPDFFLH